MSSKQEAQRKRVYEFYLANRSQGKIFTVNHFKAENFARRTIYNIIERAEHDSGHERVKGSGRIAKKMKKRTSSVSKTCLTIEMQFLRVRQLGNSIALNNIYRKRWEQRHLFGCAKRKRCRSEQMTRELEQDHDAAGCTQNFKPKHASSTTSPISLWLIALSTATAISTQAKYPIPLLVWNINLRLNLKSKCSFIYAFLRKGYPNPFSCQVDSPSTSIST